MPYALGPLWFLFSDVTILARPARKGRMDDSLEKFRIFRSMGIMARSAIHDTRLYIDVSLTKSRTLKVVALPA